MLHKETDMKLSILGTRGVPAKHGGFETFAENLALFLAKKGWKITVYCQEQGSGTQYETQWNEIRRIHIPVKGTGPVSTIVFDYHATMHARSNANGPILTLGYNTAIFVLLLKNKRFKNIINMDGLEWSRKKWGPAEKAWLWINEWIGCYAGDHLIADHPVMKTHLLNRNRNSRVDVIAYGSNRVDAPSTSALDGLGLVPNQYLTIIARPEPENTILEMARAFSKKPRGVKLVILGDYKRSNKFHASVLDAAGPEVVFPGAIYDTNILHPLRYYSRLYVHGHTVGGTNPSLVEAMGAGNAVVAQDNRFNRWVAGDAAVYFTDEDSFEVELEAILSNDEKIKSLRENSYRRHGEAFSWEYILSEYEKLIMQYS